MDMKKLQTKTNDSLTILIVADQNFFLQEMASVFRQTTYRILIVDNQYGALEVLENLSADITILDHGVAGFDALALQRLINNEFPAVTTFILADSTDLETVSQIVDSVGPFNYFSHPLDGDSLLGAVRQVNNRANFRYSNQYQVSRGRFAAGSPCPV